MQPVHRMSQPQLQRHIRWLARDSASVMFTEHVLVRMRQRRILQIEVLDVLRQGRLAGTPEPNAAKARWNAACSVSWPAESWLSSQP